MKNINLDLEIEIRNVRTEKQWSGVLKVEIPAPYMFNFISSIPKIIEEEKAYCRLDTSMWAPWVILGEDDLFEEGEGIMVSATYTRGNWWFRFTPCGKGARSLTFGKTLAINYQGLVIKMNEAGLFVPELPAGILSPEARKEEREKYDQKCQELKRKLEEFQEVARNNGFQEGYNKGVDTCLDNIIKSMEGIHGPFYQGVMSSISGTLLGKLHKLVKSRRWYRYPNERAEVRKLLTA